MYIKLVLQNKANVIDVVSIKLRRKSTSHSIYIWTNTQKNDWSQEINA